jgi:hypothetical protein
MRLVCAVGLLGLLHAASGAISTGPEVGQKIPAFSLVDHTGAKRNFESLKGPNGLLLAFVRSADW